MAKDRNAKKEDLPKRYLSYWIIRNSNSTLPNDHLSARPLTFSSRTEALVAVREDRIDPFVAALGFPGFYLVKTVYKNPKRSETYNNCHYFKRYVEHYYSLTNAEKAFLARRVANHA